LSKKININPKSQEEKQANQRKQKK
jgi:hypothetical protein